MPTLETKQLTVSDLFSDHFVFEFPEYQRPYRWTDEQANALLSDLLHACAGGEDIANTPPFFIGSVVLVRREGRTVFVIDGRQRLTTLAMLFAVLRDIERDARRKGLLHACLYDEEAPEKGVDAGFRLRPRGTELDFLNRWVFSDGATTQEMDRSDETPDRLKQLAQIAQTFRTRLARLSDSERTHLITFVLQRCEVVTITAMDEAVGLRIFQVLNARGLPLSQVDILKSHVISAITQTDKQAAADKWDDFDAELGGEGMEDLLRAILFIYSGAFAPGELTGSFLEAVNGRRLEQLIEKDLEDYAEALARIRGLAIPYSDVEKDPNALVQSLDWLDIRSKDWLAVALEIIVRGQDDEARIYRLLHALERSCYTFFILGNSERDRREVFSKTLSEFSAGLDPARIDGPLWLSPRTSKRMLERLGQPFDRANHRGALMRRIEAALSKGDLHPLLDRATVEHILPQNPSRNSKWSAEFDRAARTQHLHLLGNLLLLPVALNKRVGNAEFEAKKRAIVKDSGRRRRFKTEEDIAQYPEWTPNAIRSRTERFVDILAKGWGLTAG